ncbi:MAG: hypothetical protein IJ744_07225 [Lachnospiraceae bacterium]|nr:hypothetical protein [Lachnospiraceae bacterium]
MIGLYFVLGLTAIVAGVVLLDFFGPVRSEKPFWTTIRKIRAVLDAGSYWIICAIAIFCIAIVVIYIILRLFR